ERCELLDGQPTCLPETFSSCWLTNSRHYHTFDGKDFDFVGSCSYILSTSCSTSGATTSPPFSVVARNQDGGNLRASDLHSVVVQVYDLTIVAVKGEKGLVRVNHHLSHLPISLANGKLHLQQKGKSFLLQTDFKLKLLYNWEDHVLLKVPSKLSNHVCGLCGNANGDPWDDTSMANGELAEDIVELAQS
ncbi:FCGBP protein, partial [Bucco capensis]|nr:FCGBP protein [Bucco capensis]